MTQFIKSIFYSELVISLAVFALTSLTVFTFEVEDFLLPTISALFVFAAYTLLRLLDLLDKNRVSTPKMEWYKKFAPFYYFALAASIAGISYLLLTRYIDLIYWVILLAIPIIFYNKYPTRYLFKEFRGLRGHVLTKIPILIFSWIGVVFFMPWTFFDEDLTPKIFLYILFLICWLVSNAMLYDLRNSKAVPQNEEGNFFRKYSFASGLCLIFLLNLAVIFPFLLYAPELKQLIIEYNYELNIFPVYFLLPNIILLFMIFALKIFNQLLSRWTLFFVLADLSFCIPWIIMMHQKYVLDWSIIPWPPFISQ